MDAYVYICTGSCHSCLHVNISCYGTFMISDFSFGNEFIYGSLYSVYVGLYAGKYRQAFSLDFVKVRLLVVNRS